MVKNKECERKKYMKKSKIIAIIVCIIIIIILMVALNINNSNRDINSNELNTQNNIDASNTTKDNTLESNNKNQIFNTTSIEVNQKITNSEDVIENTENSNLGSDNMNNQSEEIKVNLIVNNRTFSATLINNETTRELVAMFPMTLNMSDLHSNEKYNYLDSSFTTNSSRPTRINAGDIKLYGNNCLVIFYESFSNSYSYTDLGKVDDVDAFVSELGSGSINIRFELAN